MSQLFGQLAGGFACQQKGGCWSPPAACCGSTSLCWHPRGAGAWPCMAEGSRRWVGAVWAQQSCCPPAPCGAGRAGQRIFLACCPARAQRFPARPDPSFCRAVGSSAKPRGISLELSKRGLGKQGRFPCRSAARAVLMSLFHFGGGSLGRDVVDGGRGRSLSIAAPLAAFPESAGTQAWSAFPVPACPQPLCLACVKGLACAQYLGYYL